MVTCSACEVCFLFVSVYYVFSHTLRANVCVCRRPRLPGVVYVEMKALGAQTRVGSRAGLEVWQAESGGAEMQHNQTELTLTGLGDLNLR